jgi:tetratricopeptide (TPR) repeat protein
LIIMKVYNIVFLGASLISLSSCSGFLDETPQVQTSVQSYYSSDAEANTAIMGCYSVLQKESFELAPFMLIGDDCSDDADIGNSNSEAYSWLGSPEKQLQSFDVISTNWISNALWGTAFPGVEYCCQAIESITNNKSELTATKADQYLGEAHYLRAMFYFFLTRQYGSLPIVDHVLKYNEYYSKRASQDETWNFIEKDLIVADSLLPLKSQYSSSDLGRATKGAAESLLGEVYMYEKKYQDAYNILKKVVESGEYSLEPEYADIFTLEHENGCESIFEIQHSISGTGWSDSNEGSILSFYEHDADPNDSIKWHNGWSMHCPTQDLVDSYEEGDPRLHATIIFKNEYYDGRINKNVASSTGYESKVWYVPFAQRSQTDQSDEPKNIIFMRYANVLLYLSEACNELGKTDESLNYLEMVRGRARSDSSDPSVLPVITERDKDKLRSIIWHERRVELACQGQRFWDLVREGRAGSIMKNYSQKYNSIKGSDFTVGTNEIFPIPEDQITNSNGTMEQNTGY